mmetsp:Transcript_19971/g.54433  ORF Transcript_19971/g.54433 Transcript_19971/m.54433 type:complete len:437 (+) Transcript_19971:129-1439(+)
MQCRAGANSTGLRRPRWALQRQGLSQNRENFAPTCAALPWSSRPAARSRAAARPPPRRAPCALRASGAQLTLHKVAAEAGAGPAEVVAGVGLVVVAVRLRQGLLQVRVLALEGRGDVEVPRHAPGGVVDAVPEFDADAIVRLVVVLQLRLAELLPRVVLRRRLVELVQAEVAGLLKVVRAIALAGHRLAEAARVVRLALLRLLADGHLRARTREGVPAGVAAVGVLAVAGEDAGVEGHVLAADDGAVLVVGLLAAIDAAPAAVEGHVGPKLGLRLLVEVARVLHRDLEAPDARDAELPGALHDDLVVEVPEHAREVRGVDVLVFVGALVLRAVHVKGVLLCAAGLGIRLGHIDLLPREVGEPVGARHCRRDGVQVLDAADVAAVRDRGDGHLVALQGEFHEAVLVVVASVVGLALTGDAAAAAADDPAGAAQEVGV